MGFRVEEFRIVAFVGRRGGVQWFRISGFMGLGSRFFGFGGLGLGSRLWGFGVWGLGGLAGFEV